MKKGLILAALALLCTVWVASTAVDQTMADDTAAADTSKTLTGQFNWNDRTQGALEAVFTGTDADKWDVAFHFEFREKPHVYSGTAEGSLNAGLLSGTVQNESKKRTFNFTGEFVDGKFQGTHEEATPGGRSGPTGTITLAE